MGRNICRERRLSSVSFIPFCRYLVFTGSRYIFHLLERHCTKTPCRVALVVLSMVARSEVAIEFSYRMAGSHTDTRRNWIHRSLAASMGERFTATFNTNKAPVRARRNACLAFSARNWFLSKILRIKRDAVVHTVHWICYSVIK